MMTTTAPTQEQVDRIAAELAPDVVRIFCRTGPDSFGDPSVYLRVVLSDEAARHELRAAIVDAVKARLTGEFDLDGPDRIPYFRFRTASASGTRRAGLAVAGDLLEQAHHLRGCREAALAWSIARRGDRDPTRPRSWSHEEHGPPVSIHCEDRLAA